MNISCEKDVNKKINGEFLTLESLCINRIPHTKSTPDFYIRTVQS